MYADVALSNGIESFLVFYGRKDKKIDIIDNLKVRRKCVEKTRILSCIYRVRYYVKFL